MNEWCVFDTRVPMLPNRAAHLFLRVNISCSVSIIQVMSFTFTSRLVSFSVNYHLNSVSPAVFVLCIS